MDERRLRRLERIYGSDYISSYISRLNEKRSGTGQLQEEENKKYKESILNVIMKELPKRYEKTDVSDIRSIIQPQNVPLQRYTYADFHREIWGEEELPPIYTPFERIMELQKSGLSFSQAKKQEKQERVKYAHQKAPYLMHNILSSYPLSKAQAEAVYKIFATPAEKIQVGTLVTTKVKGGGLFKKPKKKTVYTPIYEDVYPSPKAIQENLSSLFDIEPGQYMYIGEEIRSKISEPSQKLIEYLEKVKLPTEDVKEAPVWMRGYKGQSLMEKTLSKIKEEREKKVKSAQSIKDAITSILNATTQEEILKTIGLYRQLPFLIEVGEKIAKESKGKYDMTSYFQTLNEISEKGKSLLNQIDQMISQLYEIEEKLKGDLDKTSFSMQGLKSKYLFYPIDYDEEKELG